MSPQSESDLITIIIKREKPLEEIHCDSLSLIPLYSHSHAPGNMASIKSCVDLQSERSGRSRSPTRKTSSETRERAQDGTKPRMKKGSGCDHTYTQLQLRSRRVKAKQMIQAHTQTRCYTAYARAIHAADCHLREDV